MSQNSNDRLFDLRTLERNLEKGLITREQLDAYLAELEDVADKGEVVEAEFVEGVLDKKDGDAADEG